MPINSASNFRATLLFTVALLAVIGALGQKPDRSIPQILTQLRSNMDNSVATLPDVFCDEHLDSYENRSGKIKREVTLDSVIKARRQSGGADEFAEERSVRLLDGKPSRKDRRIDLPFSIADGFGSVFRSYLAQDFEQCNRYRLLPNSDASNPAIVLEVSRNIPSLDPKVCAGLKSDSVAIFRLDADSLQIREFQMIIPGARLAGGFNMVKSTTDYRLVPLGARTYLIPAKVHARATKPSGADQLVYDAEYSNCHRFGSSITILPESQEVPGKPE